MNAIDRRCGLLLIGLFGLTACSHSNSPTSPTSSKPSTNQHRGDFDTQQVSITADLPPEALIAEPVAVDESIDYYSDGSLRRTYEFYSVEPGERVFHGEFVEFYPNGKRFSAGSYAHGLRHGRWEFWHQNGQTARLAVYSDGVAEGEWVWYRQNGTRWRASSYMNGKLEGNSITFADDGQTPIESEAYRLGLRHGLQLRWYPAGQKAVEIEFKDGVPDGREIRWHDNGQKQAEGQHRGGSPHGVFHYWASDGTPVKSVQWQNGRRVRRSIKRGQDES